ncbi:unnamed protein product [Brassica rapa subsp. trilocularis]
MTLWVLEDAEKQEWSSMTCDLITFYVGRFTWVLRKVQRSESYRRAYGVLSRGKAT